MRNESGGRRSVIKLNFIYYVLHDLRCLIGLDSKIIIFPWKFRINPLCKRLFKMTRLTHFFGGHTFIKIKHSEKYSKCYALKQRKDIFERMH